ncbi:MAG: primosomal protein N' [Lachnospiraceae bacterium]|nr:primosomal protein N' [Lachnospiraceae bacterium]
MYARVIIEISHESLDRTFEYRIPESLKGKIEVGNMVKIPFGKANRMITGYVTDITKTSEYPDEKIKDLAGVVKNTVSIQEKQVLLALWMKKTYGSTMIQALKTVLPVKRSVKKLEKRRVILNVEKDVAVSELADAKKKNRKAQARLLAEIIEAGEMPEDLITTKLNVSKTSINALEEKGIVRIETDRVYRNPFSGKGEAGNKKILSKKQRYVVDSITKAYMDGKRETYVIRGITGSGKTEVYMELIENVVRQGKQAIVLIPEIALTYQTAKRFYERFGDRVSVMNSTLSEGEKYDQFERAKEGELDVIIGPRSALFTPFLNLGLIVIDEEHETSYKSEVMPKYHARETAEELARLSNASLILGSATPSLEAIYKVEKGIYKEYVLDERLNGGELPHVSIVDLREELRSGNRSIFSYALQDLIKDRLAKKEQIMLFINRRGYAGFISCRACGEVIKCPHCDVSLHAHNNGKLICHYCGYTTENVKICPKCGSKYVSGFKAGTQQIEEKLKVMYPEARILRMDADTTRNKDSYEEILSAFANNEADILIGTQMIVKGHDFPNVTLMGILAADMSLSVGDFRSAERTFELLTQAAGRAGRSEKPGEVVIQTYQPDHYAVQLSAKQDYVSFYKEEIAYRALMDYPPVSHMLSVLVLSKDEGKAIGITEELAKDLKNRFDNLHLIGPAPAGISKINDMYRYQFYVKDSDEERLDEMKSLLEEKTKADAYKKDFIQIDYDPMNMN